MSEEKSGLCSGGPKLIFACSGAADVGEISDRAARKMSREGVGKMFCLAGIAGRLPPIMKTTEQVSDILAIDGCALNCVKECLQLAGFNNFKHLQLADLGMAKDKTLPTEENVAKVASRGAEILQ